jgi:tetratricopeptide (TPR) repeat protein
MSAGIFLAPEAALVADYVTVEIALASNWTRRLLLVGTLIVSAAFLYHAAKFFWADRRLDSEILPSMERGAAMVPGDADAWDRLGRFRQWSFDEPDPSAAIADFQHAVHLEPLWPFYWIDLATAYETAGDAARARQAFEQAKSVYPVSAQVAWDYGNFLLRQQDFTDGYAEIQKAVRGDATLVPLAISRVWRSSQDVNILVDQILPPTQDSYFQALDFFQSNHLADPGLVVWKGLQTLGQPFPLARSFPFIEELIREDRAEDARQAWMQALAASSTSLPPAQQDSVMWDGDFTGDFINGGLGWRWDEALGVAASFDRPPLEAQGRSLRLDFGGGTNLQLISPSQFVPVEPNRAYHFHAFMRTEGITTESGVRFGIADPHHPAELNVDTANLTGSNPWQPVDVDVTTAPETHFLIVFLYRLPSRLFENKLSGTVWAAGVTLTPGNRAPERARP